MGDPASDGEGVVKNLLLCLVLAWWFVTWPPHASDYGQDRFRVGPFDSKSDCEGVRDSMRAGGGIYSLGVSRARQPTTDCWETKTPPDADMRLPKERR